MYWPLNIIIFFHENNRREKSWNLSSILFLMNCCKLLGEHQCPAYLRCDQKQIIFFLFVLLADGILWNFMSAIPMYTSTFCVGMCKCCVFCICKNGNNDQKFAVKTGARQSGEGSEMNILYHPPSQASGAAVVSTTCTVQIIDKQARLA